MAGRDTWDRFWADARDADILMVAQSLGARLKNGAANEWAGPCPVCGGDDRFSVNTRKGVFNCRGCGGKGTPIDMVMMVTGCSVLEAAEQITGQSRPDRSRDETEEERAARIRAHQVRVLDLERRNREDLEQAEAHRVREEEHVAKVIERAGPVWDSPHGLGYLTEARKLNPSRRLLGDIRFVAELDYWGYSDNGSGELRYLDTLPAVIALIRDFAGSIIGISQTYLDPKEPKKWTPPNSASNQPTKVRGEKKGGMIRLGRVGETLALAEGYITALSWYAMGYGPEDVTLAAAVDLGNLAGRALGTVAHPTLADVRGRPVRIPNGLKPDPDELGVILPDGVKSVILVGDRDSETFATAAKMMTAAMRFRAKGLAVELSWPPAGKDFNQMLLDGWTP
jgi:hypothetical protein